MRTGDKATRNGSGKTSRDTDEVNAAHAAAAPAPATRQETATDTKRPWAVRKAEGPSWAEKVDQF